MTIDYLKSKISNECRDYDIIVLKGFSPDLIEDLGHYYSMLDEYVIENGKVILENINENRLMLSILSASVNLSICTIESFIKLCTQITGLGVLQKRICVLDNNMLDLYPNPTNTDIPDFDSADFEDTEGETSLYSAFYSFCINEDNVQRVQYIDNYSDSNSCVDIKYSTITSHEICVYCATKDPIVKISEFLNSLGVADYYRQGGDQPAIFIRINNPYYLNSIIKGGRYNNDILESIYEKYRYSERIFTYFFTTKMTNEQRWDFIEAYFLGESEEKLLNFVPE